MTVKIDFQGLLVRSNFKRMHFVVLFSSKMGPLIQDRQLSKSGQNYRNFWVNF